MVFADNLAFREFAISCSFAMAINFVITVLTEPALLALLPLRKPSSSPEARFRSERYAHAFVGGLQRRKGIVLLVGFAVVVLSITAIPRIEINSDYFDFCHEESEAVRAKHFCSRHFEGGSFLTVVLETHTRDGIFAPEGMKSLYLLHEFLERECGHPFGWVNYMNEYQASLGRPLPTAESPPGEAEFGPFATSFPPNFFEAFLDFDRSRSAIRLKVVATGSKDTAAIESRILDFARAHLPDGIEVRITGEKSLVDRLSDATAQKLFENLAGLCLVTAVLISVFVRSWRQGLVFLVVNLVPVAAIYGAMGWLSIPLGLGTCAVALIVFGIAVDDTIHLILRYNRERRNGSLPAEAAASALCLELHPIVATSVIICGGIIVVVFSPAPINSDIGILFVIGTGAALAADVFLTPLLIVLAERPRRS
jgi:predicted RND superfamily exporter protein